MNTKQSTIPTYKKLMGLRTDLLINEDLFKGQEFESLRQDAIRLQGMVTKFGNQLWDVMSQKEKQKILRRK